MCVQLLWLLKRLCYRVSNLHNKIDIFGLKISLKRKIKIKRKLLKIKVHDKVVRSLLRISFTVRVTFS